jgi:hypothetical protein
MSTRKILLSAAALLVGVAVFFTGRASAFLNTAPKLYFTTAGTLASCTALLTANVPSQFTTMPVSGTTQAYIVTSSNTARKLFYTSDCTINSKVFFQ